MEKCFSFASQLGFYGFPRKSPTSVSIVELIQVGFIVMWNRASQTFSANSSLLVLLVADKSSIRSVTLTDFTAFVLEVCGTVRSADSAGTNIHIFWKSSLVIGFTCSVTLLALVLNWHLHCSGKV